MEKKIRREKKKFECMDCGCNECPVLKATNKRLGWKEVAIIAEALPSSAN